MGDLIQLLFQPVHVPVFLLHDRFEEVAGRRIVGLVRKMNGLIIHAVRLHLRFQVGLQLLGTSAPTWIWFSWLTVGVPSRKMILAINFSA